MIKSMNKSTHCFTFCILCLCIFFNVSCANSRSHHFKNRIQKMSDNDLLSYYHGIHERIKDIDNSNREGRSENPTEHERMISNRTFFLSGEGHDLIQQEKIVLEELNDRDLTP